MANRPVYEVGTEKSLCRVHLVEFTYANGLSKQQRQKCSSNLRNAFLENKPGCRVLEVSRYSDHELGIKLSAFNLTVTTKEGRKLTVECAYQGGKITKEYGQLTDLYDKTSMEAKKDSRKNGTLLGFMFDGEEFGLNPTTAFYNWLYIRALAEHPEFGDELMEYDAFTDIVFNPQKGKSCQAEACAYYVGLRRSGLLEEALESKEKFIELLYHVKPKEKKYVSDGTVFRSSHTPITAVHENMAGKISADVMKNEEKKREEPQVIMKVGDEVTHPKFGAGVIMKIEGGSGSEILTVKFAIGEKHIAKNWLIQAMEKMNQ